MTRAAEHRVTFILAAMLIAGCSQRQFAPLGPSTSQAPASEEGLASWYGPGFHGHKTTSGEVYDQYALTAAHRTLPLGTRLAVTNLGNGRVVEVRINDRGPFVEGRIVDLSYAAAQTLGIVEPGTAMVRIQIIGEGPPTFPRVRYEVQVGAFADRSRAAALHARIRESFKNAHLTTISESQSDYHRIRIGPYASREEALLTARRVRELGVPAMVVEEERRQP